MQYAISQLEKEAERIRAIPPQDRAAVIALEEVEAAIRYLKYPGSRQGLVNNAHNLFELVGGAEAFISLRKNEPYLAKLLADAYMVHLDEGTTMRESPALADGEAHQ